MPAMEGTMTIYVIHVVIDDGAPTVHGNDETRILRAANQNDALERVFRDVSASLAIKSLTVLAAYPNDQLDYNDMIVF